MYAFSCEQFQFEQSLWVLENGHREHFAFDLQSQWLLCLYPLQGGTRDHWDHLVLPLLRPPCLWPFQDHLVLPPSEGQKVSVLLSRPSAGGCNGQSKWLIIHVAILTPHIPSRFLYSSSRALSNACRAASALFRSIAMFWNLNSYSWPVFPVCLHMESLKILEKEKHQSNCLVCREIYWKKPGQW